MSHPLLLLLLALAIWRGPKLGARIAGWTATRRWLQPRITQPITRVAAGALIILPMVIGLGIADTLKILAVVTVYVGLFLLVIWALRQLLERLPYRVRRRRIVAEVIGRLPASAANGIEVAPLLHWLRYELGHREALTIMNQIGADPTVACHRGRLYRAASPAPVTFSLCRYWPGAIVKVSVLG